MENLNLLLLTLQVLVTLSPTHGFQPSEDTLALLSKVCEYAEEEHMMPIPDDGKNQTEHFREHDEYSTEWVVRIIGGDKVADDIALKNGFINKGKIVATDDNTEVDTYSFVLTKDEVMSMMRFTQYENKTQQLLRLKNVVYAEQKKIEIICSNDDESENREKRLAPAANLRPIWVGRFFVVLLWDHSAIGPPQLHYNLIHASIAISYGRVSSVDITLYRVSRTATSYYLPRPQSPANAVDRNNINIVHLTAVSPSSTGTSLFFYGRPTIRAPTNIRITAISCTSAYVSWVRPLTYARLTYAIVVYDGSHIRAIYTGLRTYGVINNLYQSTTYVVFVVAIQGNYYGVSYQFYNFVKLGCWRLFGGQSRCQGHLQVYQGLQWASTCDRRFGSQEARVACRQIGCPTLYAQKRPISIYGGRLPSPRVYRALGYSCYGSESRLEHCRVIGAVCSLSQNRDIVAVSCQ